MTQQRILVTGATGYIAAHIVKEALERGYIVRGTVRSESKAQAMKKIFVFHGEHFETAIVPDLVSGDYSEALKDVSAIIHVASPVNFTSTEPKDVLDPAIEGTLNVFRAAEKAGIKRIILTSSIAAVITEGAMGLWMNKTYGPDDWNPMDYEFGLTLKNGGLEGGLLYMCSKACAERAAWDFVQQHPDIKLTTVNPSLVVGPPIHPVESISSLNTTVAMFLPLLNGVFPQDIIPVFCDVRDSAVAHIAALQNDDTVGKRITIGEEHYTMWKSAKIIYEKRPELRSRLPEIPPIDPTTALPGICGYDSTYAKETLGIKLRSFEESLLETVDYLLVLEKELGPTNQ